MIRSVERSRFRCLHNGQKNSKGEARGKRDGHEQQRVGQCVLENVYHWSLWRERPAEIASGDACEIHPVLLGIDRSSPYASRQCARTASVTLGFSIAADSGSPGARWMRKKQSSQRARRRPLPVRVGEEGSRPPGYRGDPTRSRGMRSAGGTHQSAIDDHHASGLSDGVRMRRFIAITLRGSASQMAGASSRMIWYARLKRARRSSRLIAESALSTAASNAGF